MAAVLLLAYSVADPGAPIDAAAQRATEAPKEKEAVVLKWLGTAGWEIQIGSTVILINPFLTRGEANHATEWKTNEEAVLRVIKRADYIFAGHSHADHIADIPFIAKKFGSKVIGSRTTTNIALTAGVDKSQLITIRGGEKLDFKEFSVQVIASEHGALVRGGRNSAQSSKKSLGLGPGQSWETLLSREEAIAICSPSAIIACYIRAPEDSSKTI